MKSKLIIGCGYVGHRVAKQWLANGDSVMAMTRSADRATQFSEQGIQPLIGDVVAPQVLQPLAEPGRISTLLYAVGFDRSADHSKHEVYVNGLKRVLDSVAGSIDHFIYVSSISVYGQSNGEWIGEDTDRQPNTDGGRICLEAEQLIHDTFSNSPTRHTILRFAGIYGPDRVLRRVDSLKNAEPIAGNPDGYLNLIHVDDGVAAVLAAETNETAGPAYVVSDGQELTRREYFTTLAELVDAPTPVFDTNAPQGNRPTKAGLNKRCKADRLINELGVTLTYPTARTGLIHALGIRN